MASRNLRLTHGLSDVDRTESGLYQLLVAPGAIRVLVFQWACTAVRNALCNRCLGITVRGDLGLFPGWGRVPFRMRTTTPGGSLSPLHRIGDCYVHGIMNGEGVADVIRWGRLAIA